jgi:hypothetical protein
MNYSYNVGSTPPLHNVILEEPSLALESSPIFRVAPAPGKVLPE